MLVKDIHSQGFHPSACHTKEHLMLFLLEHRPCSCPICRPEYNLHIRWNWCFIKNISFRLNHIYQNMAPTPTNNSFLSLSFILCTHPPNTCLILVGVESPKVICITLQINLTSAQSKNKYWIVSRLSQKQHLTFPCQFRLTKLSLVSIASL
jgi:hypothetical protein